MKLLLCGNCRDVVRLFGEDRSCLCGRSKGRYVDDRHRVEVEGPCDVLAASTRLVYGTKSRSDLKRIPEPHALVRRRDNGWHSMLGAVRTETS